MHYLHQRKKRNKGFTLIELIVVMAITGILVLLAAPRFLGWTNEAKLTNIKNDVRVAEGVVEEVLIEDDDTYESWEDISEGEINIAENDVYGKGGLVHELDPGAYRLLSDEFVSRKVNSQLDGEFLANNQGTVYYIADDILDNDDYEDGTTNHSNDEEETPSDLIFVAKAEPTAAETEASYFTWTETATEVTITGYSDAGPKDVTIPEEINGKPVTAIGFDFGAWKGAFEGMGLTSVYIPDTVTLIDQGAFWNNNLTTVTLSYNVKEVGFNAFNNNNIDTLVVPGTVREMGQYAFANNNMTEVTLNHGITTIGDEAFRGNSLTELVLPASVETIGRTAFFESDIVNLTLSNSLTRLEEDTFTRNNITEVILPDGMTTLERGVFNGNPLETVYIPDSMEDIGESAFLNSGLPAAELPSHTTFVESGFWSSFDSATNLTFR